MSSETALSAINAFQRKLDNTGHSISNVDTTGFKDSYVAFSETGEGAGVQVDGVFRNDSQGNISASESPFHLAIDGNGYFRLNDNGAPVYTRNGTFTLDREGYITSTTGARLTGYGADETGALSSILSDLQILTTPLPSRATTAISSSLNLNASDSVPSRTWVGTPTFGGALPDSDTYNSTIVTNVYDSLGNRHTLTGYFSKTTTANIWNFRAQIDGIDVPNTAGTSVPFELVFTGNGILDTAASDTINIRSSPLDSTGSPNGATSPQDINIDLNATQFGTPFSITSLAQDGYETGNLRGVEIEEGLIIGSYDNGNRQTLGQIALSNFTNPQGLTNLGNSNFGESLVSGESLVGVSNVGAFGSIQSNALENSNVNLTEKLIDLATTQQLLQAAGKLFQTQNDITEDLINRT